MSHSPIDEGAGAVHRAGEPLVRGIHRPSRVVDAHPQPTPRVIEAVMQQLPLSDGDGAKAARPGVWKHQDCVVGSLHRLHSAHVQMRRSSLVLAELHDLLRTTMECIRVSQQRIAASDRLIMRAQTLGCEEPHSDGQ